MDPRGGDCFSNLVKIGPSMNKEKKSIVSYHPKFMRFVFYLSKNIQRQIDQRLQDLNLSSATYPYLLELADNEDINLCNLSQTIKVTKAMATRTVNRLVAMGYVCKNVDPNDSRAYQLKLTEKARGVIPELCRRLREFDCYLVQDMDERQYAELRELLHHILKKTADFTSGEDYAADGTIIAPEQEEP